VPAPQARIQTQISNASRTRLKGTLHPLAQTRYDSGRVQSSMLLHGISMVFSRSQAQEADLKALIKAQQTPSSPLYHKWLMPDEFAARFGMAQSDLNAAEQWLKQQGFTVDRVSRSRDRIYFSGTVAQVEAALATQMHYYTVDGKKEFAPSTELSLPAVLSGVVMDIGNLSSFRPKPMMHIIPQSGARSQSAPKADFTSGTSGSHFAAPGDLQVIYDVNAVYNAGWTGTGQSIAIAGESFIDMNDIEHFQTASGWSTPKDPTMVLVPDTGDDGVAYQGDEAESDLDLEWSSTMAPAATIFFVYTGGGGNANVFNSVEYAVDTRIVPIISLSYGGCEMDFQSSDIQAIEAINEQGVAQGQTILIASGDDGASRCFRDRELSTQDRTALAVSYPASSPNVTAVGGTQFSEGSGSYWNSSSGTGRSHFRDLLYSGSGMERGHTAEWYWIVRRRCEHSFHKAGLAGGRCRYSR
jgi:subtilase family serine protease